METNEAASPMQKSSAEVAYFPTIIPLPYGAILYDEEDVRLDNIVAEASVTALDPHDDPDNG